MFEYEIIISKPSFICKSYFSYNEDKDGHPIKALRAPNHDDLLLVDPEHVDEAPKLTPSDVQNEWNPDKNITGGGKLTDSNSDLVHEIIHMARNTFTAISIFEFLEPFDDTNLLEKKEN